MKKPKPRTGYHKWVRRLIDAWGWSGTCKRCGLKARSSKGPRGGHALIFTAIDGHKYGERDRPGCKP